MTKTLAQKIIAVADKLGAISKDKTNPHHRYNYVSAEKFIETVRGPLIEEGIVLIPRFTAEWLPQNSPKGTSGVACHMLASYLITDGETEFEASVCGEGWDSSGDKASYKAMTGAHKYLLRVLFNLPMTDDPEGDGHTASAGGGGGRPGGPEPSSGSHSEFITAKQAGFLHILCKKKSEDPEKTEASIKEKFGVDSFKKIPWSGGKALIDKMAAMPDVGSAEEPPDDDLGDLPF